MKVYVLTEGQDSSGYIYAQCVFATLMEAENEMEERAEKEERSLYKNTNCWEIWEAELGVTVMKLIKGKTI